MVKFTRTQRAECGLGRGKYVKTRLSLYPVYYVGDDMFRPLWAIFRSQKCIMRKNYTMCDH